MLQIDNVSKSFGQTQALHPISHDFKQGSTTALLGPSGCGKSTLLRIIMGILDPDKGRILLDDVELGPRTVLGIRHRMGYMIQDGGLFPHLTVRKNVSLMAEYLRWDPDQISDRLNKLTELTHLPKTALDRYPTEISGGQRQRVALMRSLFLDPAVVLLDEPMGALDPLIRAELQRELTEIFQTLAKTVIVVTHDIAEAGVLADNLILMRDGQVMQVGTLKELVQKPANSFVEEFINAQRSPLESVESNS